MAWTTPRTWTPGELVTALMMNQHVRDNLNILKTNIADDGTLTPSIVRRATSDGSDDESIEVQGGGAAGVTRGGGLIVHGNEHASNPGSIFGRLGDVAGAVFRVYRGAGTQAFSVDGNTGLVTLHGGQLAFPGTPNPSADPNTLDEYEEGVWTPVIGGDGGQSGQTHLNQEGRYIKVGSKVWAACFVRLSVLGTITGNAQITGLPFVAENGVLQIYPGVVNWQGLTTSYVAMSAEVAQNTAIIKLRAITGAATHNVLTGINQADMSASTGFRVAVIYRAAA